MIDLGHWNLTIPEQIPSQTIATKQIKAGYRSKYFTPTGQAVTFWVPVTGTSTRGSTYPRSELRETFPNGKARNWLFSEGSSYLTATLAVQQVPSTGAVIIGQIHALANPTPYLKILYRQVRGVGYVDVAVRENPNDLKSPIVMTYKGMPMNTPFGYSVEVSKQGDLRVDVAGQVYIGKISSAWSQKKLYFKAGVYVMDNKGPATEGGKVTFTQLDMGHSTRW